MKLSKITFNNFRVFEDGTFDFKPLTVLTGSNSSGKSTVVKALMLLQENLTHRNNLGRLTFKNGAHNLGNFISVLTNDSNKETITFTLRFENTDYFEDKNKHVLNGIQFVTVLREYEQDKFQNQNGVLKHFVISVDKDISLIECYKNDEGSFEVEINHNWFINKILDNGLFRFNPQLYKIWDKVGVDEVNETLKKWQERLTKEEKVALQNVDVGNDEEHIKLKEKLSEFDENDDDLSDIYIGIVIEIRKIEREYSEEIRLIEKKINDLDNSVVSKEEANSFQEMWNVLYDQKESLEQNKDKKTRILYARLNELEAQNDNLSRTYYKEEEDIRHRIKIIEAEALDKIKDEYKKIKDTVREGNIRTLLYNQLKVASQVFLSSLKAIKMERSMPNLGKSTISDYLVNQEWGNKIYALTEDKEIELIANLVTWSEETGFIKKASLEDRRTEEEKVKDEKDGVREIDYKGVKFHEVVGRGDKNQLAKLLIDEISGLINLVNKPLPFISLSAMRGFQQRIYKTSQPQYHLEDALSKLLDMQHKNSENKLNFITDWIYYFGISNDKQNKFIAETIEGDYVRGFIESGLGKQNTLVNIADFGLGISQLLPIIIYTADAIDENSLICIEEPGTHLHPNLQAKLVEFMLSATRKYNIQFLIETHSETFIRKLQYEVVNNKENNPDDIIIRYLNHSNESKINQKIGIDENGELVDLDSKEIMESFGDGFLDEATKWINKRRFENSTANYNEDYLNKIVENGESKTVEFKETMFVPVYNIKDKKFIKIQYPEKIELSEKKENPEIKKAADKKLKEIDERLKSKDSKNATIHSVIKTLVAFANSDGGELFIGIGEDINHSPYISNVDTDIDSFKDGLDGFLKSFDHEVTKSISKDFHSLFKLHWIDVIEKQKKVLVVKVLPSKTHVFYKNPKEELMYIRREASTVCLTLSETFKYSKNRFNI